VKVLEALLEYNTVKTNATPLHIAAQQGHLTVVEVLLKFGASVDSQDECGRTALHIASYRGHEQIVTALLEHGSDINIMSKENETLLGLASAGIDSRYSRDYSYSNYDDFYYFAICCHEIVAEILEHHIVKMKTASLYVSNKNLQSVSNDDGIRDFQNECEEEIARLKREKVTDANVSLYDILTKGTNQLAMYAGNDSIVQVLKSDDYKRYFPIYASMINCNFRKGERRKQLLEQGDKVFHFLFNSFPQLPHDCTDKIFSYLHDEDLRLFIHACKPVSIQHSYY
jgi:hypothetical protein